MEQAADLKSAGAITSNSGVRVPSPIPNGAVVSLVTRGILTPLFWVRDLTALPIRGGMYNGSTWDFDSHSVGSIPSHPAIKLKNNVVDANIGGVRYAQNPREGGCAEAASMAVGLLQHLYRMKRTQLLAER